MLEALSDASIGSASDVDSDLNRIVDTSTKDSLKSPWKDEMESESNVISYDTDCEPKIDWKADWPGNSWNGNISTRGKYPWRTDGAERFKRSSAHRMKSLKYHWSGTFNDRLRKYSRFGGKAADDRTSRWSLDSDTFNRQEIIGDAIYNYNLKVFDDEKTTKKTKLFGCDKFVLEDNISNTANDEEMKCCYDSRSPVGRRDAESNVSQENMNFPGRDDCERIVRRHENLRSRTFLRDDGGANRLAEDADGASASARSLPSKDPPLVSDCRETLETMPDLYARERWLDKLSTSRCWNVLLSLFKHFVLFSFLPSVYVAIFMYVRRTQEQ